MIIIGLCPTCNNDDFNIVGSEDSESLWECLKCEDRIAIEDIILAIPVEQFSIINEESKNT